MKCACIVCYYHSQMPLQAGGSSQMDLAVADVMALGVV